MADVSKVEVRSWVGCYRVVESSYIQSWSDDGAQSQPVAFRVIREHKEPREFYAKKMLWPECGEAREKWVEWPKKYGGTLFREVIE